jgi:hypothetical protein
MWKLAALFQAGSEDRVFIERLKSIWAWLVALPGRVYRWLKPAPAPLGFLSVAASAVVPWLGLLKVGAAVTMVGLVYWAIWTRGYHAAEAKFAKAEHSLKVAVQKTNAEEEVNFQRYREVGEKLSKEFAAARPGLQRFPLDAATANALNKHGGDQ